MRKDLQKFRRGDVVTVRSFPEISATLDGSGSLEALPFLPEMIKYCGQKITVHWPVNKVLQGDSRGGLRQIRNVVLLDDAVCSGEAHGDCQRTCFLLWKTAWIKREEKGSVGKVAEPEDALVARPKQKEPVLPRDHICQATELTAASAPLRLLDPRRYYWDITSHLYEPSAYFRYILRGVYKRTIGRLFARRHSKEDPLINAGSLDRLGLQRGDLVEVRSPKEIRDTLDAKDRTQGLNFLPGMWEYCGQRFRVRRPVYRMISERTGGMRPLKQIVILEGLTCNGKAHGGCQRNCLIYWKEAWLRRISEDNYRRPG